MTVVISLIRIKCHEVVTCNSILGKGTHELHGVKHFTPKADQKMSKSSVKALLALLFVTYFRNFFLSCHLTEVVRKTTVLVHLLKELCETASASKILKQHLTKPKDNMVSLYLKEQPQLLLGNPLPTQILSLADCW